MIQFIKDNIKIILITILQVILFVIPTLIMLLVYKEDFFTKKTGWGLTGIGAIGIIIVALCATKVIGKMPHIVYFVIIYVLFLLFNMLSEWLVLIGQNMLIGSVLACPIDIIKRYWKIKSTATVIKQTDSSRKVKVGIKK